MFAITAKQHHLIEGGLKEGRKKWRRKNFDSCHYQTMRLTSKISSVRIFPITNWICLVGEEKWMLRMLQRCRAQWIEVILIWLQKQFQLKDFGAGDGEWGIFWHHKTQGHGEIIKAAVTMEKGCKYIRTKRNWQKSHRHTTGNFKTLSFGKSAHMLEVGQFYQPRVRVWKLPTMGALTWGASGRWVLAQRWRLGSSWTGNSWGQSSAQTELLCTFRGKQLGNWLYTC